MQWIDGCMSDSLLSFRELAQWGERKTHAPRQFLVDAASLSPRRVGIFGPTATRHRNDHIPLHCAHLQCHHRYDLPFFLCSWQKKIKMSFLPPHHLLVVDIRYYGTHSIVISYIFGS